MKSYPMTPQGYKRLKEELHNLKHVEVLKNIKDIEEARAHGDLSENAEYHAAKERQGKLAGRIAHLENKIARAEVINPSLIKSDRIQFGANVTLENMETEEIITYQLLGEEESDPENGKISIGSPLARVLIGKEVDDDVELRTSKGIREYAILEIEYK
ncbi:MAG: transcription elongation factor GreA [Myxococcota bacterium]